MLPTFSAAVVSRRGVGLIEEGEVRYEVSERERQRERSCGAKTTNAQTRDALTRDDMVFRDPKCHLSETNVETMML